MAFKNRIAAAFLTLSLSLLGALPSFLPPSLAASANSPKGLADGAGVWLNMWNYPADSDAYCLKLNACGVRNIFIQTSRSTTDAICNGAKLSQLTESAHRYKIHVIAWSFAELSNVDRDADRLIAAAEFRSEHGERLDAIAANLEKDLSENKVVAYSKRIRQAVGSNYPMVAVVYSPLNHAPQVARIPWKTLDRYYNVIAPMNYWNSKYAKIEPYDYTVTTIKKIRQLVGRPDVEVHVIGDGMGTHADSINQFLAGCKAAGATSASLYPNQIMTEEQLSCLSHYTDFFPANAGFRLAAFRQLVDRGDLSLPDQADPSDAIERGEFYRLMVKQVFASAMKPNATKVAIKSGARPATRVVDVASIRQKVEASDFSNLDALNILSQVGAVKVPEDVQEKDDYLAAPLTTREALVTAAQVVDARDALKKAISEANLSPQNRLLHNISAKAGKLLVQPAYAENAEKNRPDHGRKLNYLDAAQIIVQSTAGLR